LLYINNKSKRSLGEELLGIRKIIRLRERERDERIDKNNTG